jgi:hypothetical protein
MSKRAWIPLPEPHLALRPDELRSQGVGRSRLSANDIERPHRGVVLLPASSFDAGSIRDRCLAFAPLLKPHTFFTRRTAAALWDLPAPAAPFGTLEVGALRPGHVPFRPGIIGHQSGENTMRFEQRHGLRVPSAADVWCLLAPVIPLRELIAVGDHLISGPVARPRRPIVTPADLAEAIHRHRRTPGAALRRRAIEMLRSPVDSRPETLMRLAAIDAGLPEPMVACPVVVAGKRGPLELHADNGYPQWRIACEYEGGYHFDNPHRAKLDAERWELMADAGWRVIRVTSLDLPHFHNYVARLRRIILIRSR